MVNTLDTFEDHLSWQQKNAHRIIMQFKLLRCNHQRLKKSGWIFGQKSIHKHFTQAYIYKSKNPTAEIINVLPKHPFIFTSDSDWSVDVCAEVPAGYTIVGVYDENGDLIPSGECVHTFVSGETKVVAFEVKETGSPEPSLDATLNLTSPKGKKSKEKVKACDIRKKTLKAKLKELKAKYKDKYK